MSDQYKDILVREFVSAYNQTANHSSLNEDAIYSGIKAAVAKIITLKEGDIEKWDHGCEIQNRCFRVGAYYREEVIKLMLNIDD